MSLLVAVICSVLYVASAECPRDLCDAGQTCCPGPNPGTYGCCPQSSAVCCSDGLHCCPENTVCNLAAGRCDKVNALIPFLAKDPPAPAVKLQASVMQKAHDVTIIYCPGGQYYCQDGATCCRMPSGQYSCCPYVYASCCADGIHCCPSGTTCDYSSRYCLKNENIYQALIKTPAFEVNKL